MQDERDTACCRNGFGWFITCFAAGQILSIVAIVVLILTVNGWSAEKPDGDSRRHSDLAASLPKSTWSQSQKGPLCGIFSACTALEPIGLNSDPADFVAAKYIGRCGGSSPEEVARVVTDGGATASIFTQLSAFDLKTMDCPLVANVRLAASSDRFNHWVVAVPATRGIRIYDGIESPITVSVAEFLGIWSGVGICVSRSQAANPIGMLWWSRGMLLLGMILPGVAAFFIGNSVGTKEFGTSVSQFWGVGIASLAICAMGNVVFGDVLNHRKGVNVATSSTQIDRYQTAGLNEARRASVDPGSLLIDARREIDFRAGTIPGAVNIPVYASVWEIKEYVEHLNRDIPIVVFCQSAACRYDETIAGHFISLGFTNVTVCDAGWFEFSQPQRSSSHQ